MFDNVLQPDLDALHESAIDLLTDISDTMAQGLDLIDRHQALIEECHSEETLDPEIRNKIVACHRYVNSELEKVKNVEVTMTIVAPTSAGKSTILNAIAGANLLPSSNDAMTILPTEIAFVDGGESQPKLMLDETSIDHLRQVWRQLHQHIHQMEIEAVIVLATRAEFPRADFIRSVFENPDLQIESEVRGVDRIRETLVTINNLLRLGSIVGISTQFLSSLTKVPRIETPLPPHLSALKATGRLVLVDTPGANEGDENRSVNLANIVKDRLQASSLVLLVLNYGTFGQTNPEMVKQMVDEIAEIKGRERVYLVVNKIDERDPKNPQNLTPQQVLEIAKIKYGIADPANRVFEISARDAFLVTNFQSESQISPSTPFQDRISENALGEKYYGRSWSKKRSNITDDERQEMVEDIWGGCGFDRFLERAILTVMSDVDRLKARAIQTGLNDSSQMLQGFESCVLEGRGTIDRNLQQLEIESNELESDLREAIEFCKNFSFDAIFQSLRRIIIEQVNAKIENKKNIIADEFASKFVAQTNELKLAESSGDFDSLLKEGWLTKTFDLLDIRAVNARFEWEFYIERSMMIAFVNHINYSFDSCCQHFLSKLNKKINKDFCLLQFDDLQDTYLWDEIDLLDEAFNLHEYIKFDNGWLQKDTIDQEYIQRVQNMLNSRRRSYKEEYCDRFENWLKKYAMDRYKINRLPFIDGMYEAKIKRSRRDINEYYRNNLSEFKKACEEIEKNKLSDMENFKAARDSLEKILEFDVNDTRLRGMTYEIVQTKVFKEGGANLNTSLEKYKNYLFISQQKSTNNKQYFSTLLFDYINFLSRIRELKISLEFGRNCVK